MAASPSLDALMILQAAGEGNAIYVEGERYDENMDVDKPRLTLEGEGADVVTPQFQPPAHP